MHRTRSYPQRGSKLSTWVSVVGNKRVWSEKCECASEILSVPCLGVSVVKLSVQC